MTVISSGYQKDKREQGIKNLFEVIMMEIFPNQVKEMDIKLQEVQKVLNKKDTKRPPPKHIILKMTKLKDKEKNLKATSAKQLLTYKGAPIRLLSDFSTETL